MSKPPSQQARVSPGLSTAAGSPPPGSLSLSPTLTPQTGALWGADVQARRGRQLFWSHIRRIHPRLSPKFCDYNLLLPQPPKEVWTVRRGCLGEDEVQGPHHSESRVPAGCHLPGFFVTSQGRPRLSATT